MASLLTFNFGSYFPAFRIIIPSFPQRSLCSTTQQPGRAALAGPSKGRGRGRRSAEPQQHSVEEMEQSLKKLLNIANSSGGPAPAAFNPLLDPPEERPGEREIIIRIM